MKENEKGVQQALGQEGWIYNFGGKARRKDTTTMTLT
jgi:hypothetical protein